MATSNGLVSQGGWRGESGNVVSFVKGGSGSGLLVCWGRVYWQYRYIHICVMAQFNETVKEAEL